MHHSQRLRYLLEHFGLTPVKVHRLSGGRFNRWCVRSWIERGMKPSAVTAVAFLSWLSGLNEIRAKENLPHLDPTFLTCEWVWGGDDYSRNIGYNFKEIKRAS